jgi:hypothetical protein
VHAWARIADAIEVHTPRRSVLDVRVLEKNLSELAHRDRVAASLEVSSGVKFWD